MVLSEVSYSLRSIMSDDTAQVSPIVHNFYFDLIGNSLTISVVKMDYACFHLPTKV